MKKIIAILSILLLSGCATIEKGGYVYKPEVVENKLQKEFDSVQPPAGKKITVAVYSFKDITGQRKATPNIASFSTAVTQGAETFLIKALQDVGHGEWFEVVERVNVDNLVKERTIIKQMRDAYEGANAKPLMPMQFAGIIIEGGIVGYDSSTESGGAAYKWLGIGPQTQYSKDVVTISLRAVSVNTGKVLASVTVNKIVYSTADSIAVLKFLKGGTQSFELETGLTINEPTSLAVKATIEAGVVELIKEGQRKGIWDYRDPNKRVEEPEVVVVPLKQDSAPVVTATPAPQPEEAKPAEQTSQTVVKPVAPSKIKKPKVINGPIMTKEQVDVKLH